MTCWNETLLKIVYVGPGLSGKTTNLRTLQDRAHCGRLLSLSDDQDRSHFFDLLTVDLGPLRGAPVRLHVCATTGKLSHAQSRRLVLRGAAGVVFVADSDPSRLEANVHAHLELQGMLEQLGFDEGACPVVYQCNKSDRHDALGTVSLRSALGLDPGATMIQAAARDGVGVVDTLKAITLECLRRSESEQPSREHRISGVFPIATVERALQATA